MQDTNMRFTADELIIMQDENFFKLKTAASQKIKILFSEIENELLKFSEQNPVLQKLLNENAAKISTGENYKGLPYLILDYPRIFTAGNIFAFRTMFYWAKYFSFTIHLSGKSLEQFLHSIKENIHLLRGQNFFICIHPEQWHHHLGHDNYQSLDFFSDEKLKDLLIEKKFLKLARSIEINQWKEATGFGLKTYQNFLKIIS